MKHNMRRRIAHDTKDGHKMDASKVQMQDTHLEITPADFSGPLVSGCETADISFPGTSCHRPRSSDSLA